MASVSIGGLLNDATEKARKAQGESLNAFLASLATSAIVCGLVVAIVFFLRWKCPRLYRPRRHPESTLKWQASSFRLKMFLFPMEDISIDEISGLENYLFERYLHTLLRIFIPLALLLLPILIPLNVIDGKNEPGGVRGLDRLSFANVGLSHTNRYWAHLVLALFVVIFVCLVLRFELQYYSRLQQTMDHTQWGSSTVLLTSSSKEPLSVASIQKSLKAFHGGVRTVRINRDHRGLLAKIHERDKLIVKLEAAETSLIKKAVSKGGIVSQKTTEYSRSKPLWEKYVKRKDRPSMYVSDSGPSLPLISNKVDTIDYCRAQIVQYNHEIKFDRHHLSKLPLSNSAFVQFNHQLSTPLAALHIRARIPPSWTIKHYASYSDVIWLNVAINWWELCLRQVVVYFLVTLLVLGFVFPVSIAGSLSQVAYLANVVPGLAWLGALPSWLLATVQGALPTVMIALITAIVPLTLRLLANLQGQHSYQAVEKSVQLYYFAFLFTQIFLVVSLSAGIANIIELLPSTIRSVPAVLAESLPKASNYFFSYITIYTIGTVTASLLQINTVLQLGILSHILDKTPRQKWEREKGLALNKWGTFIPTFTNLACIGLIYSVVCPLILLFSIFCFGTLWILYHYNPPKLSEFTSPTGAFYPTAIRQLFISLYFLELCLAGLFFLVRDSDDKATCIGQGAVMIFTTVCTVVFQYRLENQRSKELYIPARLTNSTLDGFISHIKHLQNVIETSEEASSASRNDHQFPDNIAQSQFLRTAQAIIWIPRDYLGIGANESYHLRQYSNCLDVNTNGAYLDRNGKIILHDLPPA